MPRSVLWRRPVPVAVDASERLIPAGIPDKLEPAAGETFLLRDLAQLVDASSDEIAAFASHCGVLHPASVPLAELEPALGLILGDWVRGWRQDHEQLRRWVATGGTAPIPGRLAPAAYLLLHLARLPEEVQEDVDRLLRDGLAAVHHPTSLIVAGWAGLAEAATQSAEVMRLRYLEDEEIEVPLPSGLTPVALRHAFELARLSLDMAGSRSGDLVSQLQPGWLGGLVAQYSVTPGMETFPFVAVEAVGAWRTAATEASSWRDAVRELRVAPRGWRRRAATRMRCIQTLRMAAGLPPTLAERVQPKTVADRDDYRAELMTILIRRLQEEAAWPRPGAGVPVPTVGRALWSLWPKVTTQRPPRYCEWAQCTEALAPDAHGNRRYCDAHRAAAARERAARHYARGKASKRNESAWSAGNRPGRLTRSPSRG